MKQSISVYIEPAQSVAARLYLSCCWSSSSNCSNCGITERLSGTGGEACNAIARLGAGYITPSSGIDRFDLSHNVAAAPGSGSNASGCPVFG